MQFLQRILVQHVSETGDCASALNRGIAHAIVVEIVHHQSHCRVNGERGTANQDWKQFGLSNHLLLVASVSPGLSKLIWHNDVEPPLASNAWLDD